VGVILTPCLFVVAFCHGKAVIHSFERGI